MGLRNAFTGDIAGDGAKIATYVIGGVVLIVAVLAILEYVQAEISGETDTVSANFQGFLASLNPFS